MPWPGGGGTVTGAANVGGGAGQIFRDLIAGILNFKTIKAGAAGNLTVTNNANDITLDVPAIGEVNTAANVGTGTGLVYRDKTGANLNFKSLKQGTNLTIANNADDITLSGPVPGEVNTASNVGAGTGLVYRDKTGANLNLRSLIAGAGIAITNNADDITLAASSTFPVYRFMMDQVDTPNNADWAQNDGSAAAQDAVNNALVIRRFPKAGRAGIGLVLDIPAGATNMIITYVFRGEVAPGALQIAILNHQFRTISSGAAVSAWSADLLLTGLQIPNGSILWQIGTQTQTLAALGMSANTLIQWEISRNGGSGSDTYGNYLDLFRLKISFS